MLSIVTRGSRQCALPMWASVFFFFAHNLRSPCWPPCLTIPVPSHWQRTPRRSATTWILFALHAHPEAAQQLLAELRQAGGTCGPQGGLQARPSKFTCHVGIRRAARRGITCVRFVQHHSGTNADEMPTLEQSHTARRTVKVVPLGTVVLSYCWVGAPAVTRLGIGG